MRLNYKLPKTVEPPPTSKVNIGSARAIFLKKIFMMFWSVGPFWYMVYGIWYVVYRMKIAFTVYSHMFCVLCAQAVYNIVHLFLVLFITSHNIVLTDNWCYSSNTYIVLEH